MNKAENMKNGVLFLLPGFPSNELDENCFPFVQDFLIEMIEKKGAQNLTAVAIHYPFRHNQYNWHGMKVYAIGGQSRGGLTKLITWWRVMKTLYYIHKKQGFDIIHCVWLNEPALLAQVFRFFFSVKIVVTVAGQDAKKSNKYLAFLNLKKIHVAGLSRFVIDELKKHKKLYAYSVIPSGITSKTFQPADNKLTGYDILGVGSAYPLKNFTLFLEVVRKIAAANPEIRTAIIGTGDQELIALKEKALLWQLEHHVEFPGEKKRHEVIDIMSKSKVFLHTSNYEGQGFVFSEALSQGMFIVSTRVADNEKIEHIHTGNNAEELAHLVANGLSKFSRKPIILKTAESTTEDYIQLYGKLN